MERIYLDYAASTPVRPEVREAMEPYSCEIFGNPSSVHSWGRAAATALADARDRIGAALGAQGREIVFVRGGTEADNLAVFGRASLARREGRTPLVAASTVEHSAVRDAVAAVEAAGGEAIRVPVDPAGRLGEAELREALERTADVLSVMWVNNEVGSIFPLGELAPRCREAGVVLHSDAVQAIGKLPVHLGDVGLDLASVTGHKIYGPKGTGALFIRDGVEIAPIHHGGGQERGLRPGTEDVAGAVGLAEAVVLAVAEQDEEGRRQAALRDRLQGLLVDRIDGLRVHGLEGPRAPHVVNVGVPGLTKQALLMALDMEGLAASGGAACSSGAERPSHVIGEMYGDASIGYAPLRLSLGRGTTPEHIEEAAARIVQVVERMGASATPA